jgi:hypothetical protein
MITAIGAAGCGISDAVDDVNDAWDDALKAEGADSCYDVMEQVYSGLSSNSCSEMAEGETATSLAETWCESNCDDISTKVETMDVSNCRSALAGMTDCDALSNAETGSEFPASCSWLGDDLGC